MLEEIRDETGIVPQALLKKPDLLPCWRYPLDIWRELGGDRQYIAGSMGSVPSTIPFSVVILYANVAGFTKPEAMELWKEVSTIDTHWLAIASKKRKALAEQNKTAR